MEEGYYPCGLYSNDEEELEEERRIFYVAITRAKINCYLSYAEERLNGEESKIRIQSPFLKEINDTQYIEPYDFENNDKYINYENKYKNEFISSKKIKSKKVGKIRKYGNFKYLNGEDNENCINNYSDNIYLDINKGNNMFFQNSNNLMNNAINIEKLDNSMNIEEDIEYPLKEMIEKTKPKKNLNNNTNKIKNELDKKEKKTKEKSRSKDKTNNKSKLKFKTIDSFFNIK